MTSLHPGSTGRIQLYRLFFGLLTFQGVGAVYSLFSIPSDPRNVTITGFSPVRLALLTIPSATLLVGLYCFLRSLRDESWLLGLDQRLFAWLSTNVRWKKLSLLSVLIVVGSLYLLTINHGLYTIYPSSESADAAFKTYAKSQTYLRLMPYLVRLQPLVTLLLGICTQIAILLPIVQLGIKEWSHRIRKNNIDLIAFLFASLLIGWRCIGWLQPKLSPDYSFSVFAQLGTPLLDTQVWLSFVFALGLAVIAVCVPGMFTSAQAFHAGILSRLDLIIVVGIWAFAAIHWWSTPIQPNWFVAGPRYPNYEYYPNSDAYLYDSTAQSILVGEGLKTGEYTFAIRPIYGFYLAGLYGLVGLDYEKAIMVHGVILAIFPVLVYWITRVLHTRLSALIVASLTILREGNAIALIGRLSGSNSRMFMTEMPIAVGIALVTLLVLLWLRLPQRRQLIALIAGWFLAVFILIRPECGYLLLPSWILLIGITYFRSPRLGYKNILMISLGLLLFLAPWLWRNWQKTEQLYLERPPGRLSALVIRSGLGATPGQSEESEESADLGTQDLVLQNYFLSVQSSFANNQLQGLLIFPDAFQFVDSMMASLDQGEISGFWKMCCSREAYIDRFRFWIGNKWVGAAPLPSQSLIPILLNLLFIVIGLVKVSGRKKLGGVYLLMVVSSYYLVSSISLFSGGRHVQIVDWIWIVFYGVGLGTIIEWMMKCLQSRSLPDWLFGRVSSSSESLPTLRTEKILSTIPYPAICVVILLLGASLPLYEASIQPRYTEETEQTLLEGLSQSEPLRRDHPDLWMAIKMNQQNRLLILQGRALYPRFYLQNEKERGVSVTPFTGRGYNRLNFYLVGPQNAGVQIPSLERPTKPFPHGTDVLVIGCKEKNDLVAYVVYYQSPETLLVRNPLPYPLTCKPPIFPGAQAR